MPTLPMSINQPITMSSLELVDYINCDRFEKSVATKAPFPSKGNAKLEHKDFLEKVPLVLGETSAEFTADLPDSYGRPRRGYLFPKREACLMAMSYSYELQAKVFDMMTKLEDKVSHPDPMAILADPAALRLVLLEYTEKVIALEHRVTEQQAIVSEQAPKVEAFNRLAISDGSFSLREASKVCQMREKDFIFYLSNKSWIYRSPMSTKWMAYAPIQKQGYMEQKTVTGEKDDGSTWTSSQTKITPKGMAKLAIMLGLDLDGSNAAA